MKQGGGKRKGSQFERDICVKLSHWLSNASRNDLLWRSALSGGRSTVAYAKGMTLASQAGDISAVDPLGAPFISKFYVELKFYRDLKYAGLITGKGHLVEFWKTAKREAERYNKMPLMIAKQNQIPAVACLSGLGVATLELNDNIFLTHHFIDLNIILFDQYLLHATPPSE
jgi:hypothetical protein